MLREIARQGLLPYPAFFSSVKPFGTPLRPLVLRSCLVTLLLVIIPAKDAFNFILDLVSYPNLVRGSVQRRLPALIPGPLLGVSICTCIWTIGDPQKQERK